MYIIHITYIVLGIIIHLIDNFVFSDFLSDSKNVLGLFVRQSKNESGLFVPRIFDRMMEIIL